MTVLEQLFSLEGKNIIVTGGAQGIGKIVATRLAEIGANLALFDMQEEKVAATAKEIAEATGRKVFSYGMDVTDPAQVKATIEKAAADLGGLDHLFNNAGIVIHKSAYDVTPEEWAHVINVNLNGEYYMASEFARYLKANGRKGSIVNTCIHVRSYCKPAAESGILQLFQGSCDPDDQVSGSGILP